MGLRDRRFELSIIYIFQSICRVIQLVLALAVCGIYGMEFSGHDSWKGRWIYAEVTAGLSAVTAILYLLPFFTRIPFVFLWDFIIFILWIVLFGIFGKLYIPEDAAGNYRVQKMKNTVWLVLANGISWLLSAIGMGFLWLYRKRNSMFTGRAIV
ncbi:hypothetical protein GcC1_201023 [Golovinomyces cichoracearum]|uniref:MARVEL domain-containing protein n=1 Tax=Golovinomyces cichoracearum TaxID=62708 RepID=A0A420HE84_9PEZI|nr:hypothetical protein GcC1_201023 [Golovinomyces cichoracearum]